MNSLLRYKTFAEYWLFVYREQFESTAFSLWSALGIGIQNVTALLWREYICCVCIYRHILPIRLKQFMCEIMCASKKD